MDWKILVCRFCIVVIIGILTDSAEAPVDVVIFHLIDNKLWGEVDGSGIQGRFQCNFPAVRACEIHTSEVGIERAGVPTSNPLLTNISSKVALALSSNSYSKYVSVALYNIHTWKTISSPPYRPDKTLLPTTFSMTESEESHSRFGKLFSTSFSHYDGSSTTHPQSSVPRTYFRGWNESDFLPIQKHDQLISGAAFVASTCHTGDGNTKRLAHVKRLMAHFRVDSLGRCLHTRHIPEGVTLGQGSNEKEKLSLKRQAIGRYKFYLAFENTEEPGYVTEKVFDALLAGVVPVYLGHRSDCMALLPDKRAAIFVDDFHHDMEKLAAYLHHLSTNESAYEEHRKWRLTFNPKAQHALLQHSWPCRLCNWAALKSVQG